MKNTLLVLVVVIILGAGGYYFVNKPAAPESTIVQETTTSSEAAKVPDKIKEFVIEGTPFLFSVKEMRVNKGDTVTVTFVNQEGMHDWVVDEFNAKTKQIKAGETDAVTFVADKVGTFEYYCSVGQHRAQGMVGKLIVE